MRLTKTPMPEGLQRAVDDLGPDFTATALANWTEIGEAGREAYVRYLGRAMTGRGHKKRSELAAMQLCRPAIGYTNGQGVY